MPISKHEEKMINLQHQMKENQTDLQSYLAGLDSWEKDIKKKEQKMISSQASAETSGQVESLPPVRNSIHKKKLKKKKKEIKDDPSKQNKISGFDFRAWDKFDVDKALEEIDQEEENGNKTSSSEYETDEEWEMERKKHLAGAEKDKGNSLFKAGDYDQAVEAYSKGIALDATSAVLPANRAMALLKQQKYAAAELDCTTSISLDPMYVKAYLRRANARVGLCKIDEAIVDFNRVLDLEPSNKMAKTEIERLHKEKDRDQNEPPPPSTLTEGNQGIVKPIYKPPDERSKVPLRRIPIEEIGIEKPKPTSAPAGQSECSKKIQKRESEKFDSLLSAAMGETQPVLSGETLPSSRSTVNNLKQENIRTVDDAGTNSPSLNTLDSLPSKAKKKTNSDLSSLIKVASTESKRDSLSDSAKKCSEPSREFDIPQSSFQFQSDYKLLRNKPEEFFSYFKRIQPDQFPKLFGQFLDADILNRILKTLLDYSENFDVSVYNILDGLTAVKRFSMTAMFLSHKEKQVAQDLIQRLSDASVCDDSDLSSLKKKYDL